MKVSEILLTWINVHCGIKLKKAQESNIVTQFEVTITWIVEKIIITKLFDHMKEIDTWQNFAMI